MQTSTPPKSSAQPIQILPSSVSEKIAAGEVIERPSSVIKELVENSLDAGATEVTVILEDGGKSLMEVIDNGYGMGPEDLELSIHRHATSKLRNLDDLERLHTLGFRGEALPSVAAVTEMSIVSRSVAAPGSSTAFELKVTGPGSKAEPVTFGHFLGSPHGTRIQARGLFAQVPARLKFLKSQGAEVSHVREWMERLSLTHPQVGFRLVSDERTVLNLRPQDEVTRVQAILSDGGDYPVISRSNEMEVGGRELPGLQESLPASKAIRVRMHWLQGLSTPQMRRVVQVVNGRAVKDRMLQQALLAPFRQALLPGQFPAAALFVEVDPATLDVNVHPTKTEVRFLENSKVYHAVQKLVDQMIADHGAPAYVPSSGGVASASTPWRISEAMPGGAPAFQAPLQPSWDFQRVASGSSGAMTPESQASDGSSSSPSPWTPLSQSTQAAPAIQHPFHPNYYVGILFNTYVAYDLGSELGLIDQHAAHERIRYEKLRRRALSGERQPPQSLLLPEAVKFAPELRGSLEQRLSWLENLGFEAELFGEDTVLFRSIPAEWGTDQLRTRLKSLVERVLESETSHEAPSGSATGHAPTLAMDENLFEKLASEACHSAIRAGDRLEREEALALIDQLFATEHPWNCPHGRPTVCRIPRPRFEEWFQRRV